MVVTMLIFVVFPLVIANVVHQAVIIPKNYFSAFQIPVDFGVRIRGKRTVGDNKTWRGLFAVAVITSITCTALSFAFDFPFQTPATSFGFLIGSAYMLAELPNSFMKRRFDIQEGMRGNGKIGFFFSALDHTDSILGTAVALFFLIRPDITVLAVLVAVGVPLHFILEYILRRLGYRKVTAR